MLISFVLAGLVTFPLLLLLKKIKGLQVEREEGPQSHKRKSGTPTMGGIGFVIVISILSFFSLPSSYFSLILLFLGFVVIGFLDDFLKILRKQNQGLTFWQKIILQIAVSSAFLFMINVSGFYFLFCLFVVVGGANATNLTDGLDGLLAGSGAITFFCFGYILMNQFFLEASNFAFIIGGGLLGFLAYNFPRRSGARLFMGDVGSLPVGAALSGLAILTHNELLLIVIAGLFIIEALSVIIQVTSFKLFRKRVFKMTPLHHHFELLGWSEPKIVISFWLVSFILGLSGILIAAYAL